MSRDKYQRYYSTQALTLLPYEGKVPFDLPDFSQSLRAIKSHVTRVGKWHAFIQPFLHVIQYGATRRKDEGICVAAGNES